MLEAVTAKTDVVSKNLVVLHPPSTSTNAVKLINLIANPKDCLIIPDQPQSSAMALNV